MIANLLLFALLADSPQSVKIEQASQGWCSPPVSAVQGGTATLTINCNGVEPKALKRLNTLLSKFDLAQRLEKANEWVTVYRGLILTAGSHADEASRQAAALIGAGELDKGGAVLDLALEMERADEIRSTRIHVSRAQVYFLQFLPFQALEHLYIAYTNASKILVWQAAARAIDTDSVILAVARDGLNPDERQKYIVESDKELKKRLLLLHNLENHERLLQSYFEVLRELAGPKPPNTAPVAAKAAFDSVTELGSSMRNSSISGVKVQGLISFIPNLEIHEFKSKLLDDELKARSKEVVLEIASQEAFLRLITTELVTDLTADFQMREMEEIIEPYIDHEKLSKDWMRLRRELLQSSVTVASIQPAVDAVSRFREGFIGIVENRLNQSSIAELISSINSLLDSADRVQQLPVR